MSRDDAWHRRKQRGEQWPRFTVEVPPELADALDAAVKRSLGVNVSAFSRANATRSALRLLLNTLDPEKEPAIDSTAEEVAGWLAEDVEADRQC